MNIETPLKKEDIEKLKAGDIVKISGKIYTARDAAHKKMCELLEKGLKGMIGKGERSDEVKNAIVKNKAVYFAAAGGAAALISRAVISSRVIAYEELGTEAVRELLVKDFPVIVINDIYGNDLYTEGQKKYREE